jgi:hypothetical protein
MSGSADKAAEFETTIRCLQRRYKLADEFFTDFWKKATASLIRFEMDA